MSEITSEFPDRIVSLYQEEIDRADRAIKNYQDAIKDEKMFRRKYLRKLANHQKELDKVKQENEKLGR